MAQSLPRSSPRSFAIGLLIAAALLVMLGEKASAQDYMSFYHSFLQPSYTIPDYASSATIVPPAAPPMNMRSEDVSSPFGPLPGFPLFGPLPPSLCGDPWTTPGTILYGGDIPLRVCVL